MPKYSIVIPSRNGGKYLHTCVESIVSQQYQDYELIISDDHSTDGTDEFLKSLNSENITVIRPPQTMSMSEHWDWALSHASGEWLIFVGQDDGLQPHFFRLADRLTTLADNKHLRAIMSERAYYFWPGCEAAYGDIAARSFVRNKTKICSSRVELVKALFGIQTYFHLPEMYTTSLFKRSLVEEARLKQNGALITTHPQDANLAVIACSLETRYLKSFIPLGWVGTSLKSAGMAVSTIVDNKNKGELDDLKRDYEEKIKKSSLPYNALAGDFAIGIDSIYLWQALLQTEGLHTSLFNRVIRSRVFKFLLFGIALHKIRVKKSSFEKRLLLFKNMLDANGMWFMPVAVFSWFAGAVVMVYKVIYTVFRIPRKIFRLTVLKPIKIMVTYRQKPSFTMADASAMMLKKMEKAGWKLI